MAKKLNKVFLNPTAEQIAEYGLIEGVSWFTEMDAIAAAIEDDQKKKAPERTYSLNNFQIVDGAHQITANLSKIAKQTGFTLSNDLSKVIDWAKTEIDYDVDHVTDHRVASATAEGKADLSDFQRVDAYTEFNRNDPLYPATAAGQKDYEDDIQAAKDAYDLAGSPIDGSIIGYKDLSLTNVGSKATAVEEGETFADKKTTVSQYSTFDVKGGDFSFDYQEDTVKDVDKKDPFLVTESGKLTAKASAAASGTLEVTDSVIGDIGASLSESSDEIKSLHKNDTVTDLVNDLEADAGSYETVTIDNSTVEGDITGGKVSIDKTATFKNETFLDKPEESGLYYNAVSTETNLGPTSNNKKLYLEAADTSALTEAEVKSLETEGLVVTENSAKDNIQVNKYEIVSYDIDGNVIRSGNFVYISGDEYNNLSAASKNALNNAAVENNVGWVDYSENRVVTDANFETFSTAPTGAAAANKVKNQVNKYVYTNAGGTASVTYYLTAEELGDKATPGTIAKAIDDAGYTVQTEAVLGGKFRRVAEADSVNATNYEALAKDAYSTISTSYKNYTVETSMSDDEALERNKAAIPAGFAWVKAAATDSKTLFRMSKFENKGGTSVETKYYLTAAEMSAMGFFGEGITKTYDEVKDTADPSFVKLEGWAFTDNAVGNDRLYTNAEAAKMYREGAAATTATLANYTIDKTDVVTATVPFIYQRYALTYTTNALSLSLLEDVTAPAQFAALVANDLVGANSEYVTVIDGKVVDMYQIYGYGTKVTDTATVTSDKITMNGSEIEYDAEIQEALWEGDAKVTTGQATLVDGIKTQNTKRYFDQYVKVGGEYVSATPAEEKSGEKVHEFITVAEKRLRGNNKGALTAGEIVTDVQAKINDGTGTYVAAYLDRTGTLTKNDKDGTANTAVKYYTKGTTAYALTDAEATAAAGASLIDSATPVKYFTSANANGWYVDAQAAADAMTGGDKTKVTEVAQPAYRDHAVTIADAATDISNGAYTTLKQAGQLTNEVNWLYEKAYVTEVYKTAAAPAGDLHNYDRVQIDGKDAFIEAVSGTLVTSDKTTYGAIYAWQLKNDGGGATVDGLTYYMTEEEAAKAVIGEGYPATRVFEKTGAAPVDVAGVYQYRVSKTGLDKSEYLSYKQKENYQSDTNVGALKTVNNAEAFYNIDYVVGYQVYKYTVSGDSTTYYLTEDEAAAATAAGWGTLTKGDKVDGVCHYGLAADYDPVYKPNFTVATTVYYFSKAYSGDTDETIPPYTPIWSITQDAEGKAVQAFNADGAIWSNIDGITWGEALDPQKYSNYASELCDNTYNYNYDGGEQWTAAQIEQLAASETAAGIATWKYSDKDGQVVWTRTSAIGEVSTYVMDHEDVDLENNDKTNFSKEATGTVSVINGSVVKGDISGYLNVIVSDSTVADVYGGNEVDTTTETLSTSKGSIGKDNSRTITTKETEKRDHSIVGAGLFSVGRENADKIYVDAGNVDGFETVLVDGVDTGSLTVTNRLTATDTNTQTTYQGDADALRSDYVEDWADLAFTKGIVSKVTAENTKTKTTNWSAGSAEVTGRSYEFVPGTVQDTANTVGAIDGYKKVTLTNVNAGNISADDSTSETQETYKLTTKNNVDTAVATQKTKDENKAVAELTAKNTVTNPAYEADVTVGDITGFKTVELSNYSFGDANAVGDKTVTTSVSSARDAVASDMRLINAGIDPLTGLPVPGTEDQKYTYDGTTAVTAASYANNDMSHSSDTTTKRTATGTLVASGRAYTIVNANYTEAPLLDKVYAYTQAATGRTYYLTEAQFNAINSVSKADAAQWTKDEKTTVYYRNSADAVDYNGTVVGAQVVFKYKDDADDIRYLTEGEAASYNLVHVGHEMVKQDAPASLRTNNAAKVVFGSDTAPVSTASGFVGTVAGVYRYSKAGETDQYVTEAEAAALGEGWTKDPGTEYVRKANATDRSAASVIDKATMTGDLKVYENVYDSSLIIVLTAEEAKFLDDTSDVLADYTLSNTTGYRVTGKTAGITADVDGVPPVANAAGYDTKIAEAHSYVTLNKYGQITAQAYVTDEEYAKLKTEGGKVMADYVLDDGTHDVLMPGYNKALTQYQYRASGFTVNPANPNPLQDIVDNRTVIAKAELYGWALTDEQAAAADLYAANEKSEFVLSAVTEDPLAGNTHFGNIYGYKEVGLSDMEGGNIYRVVNGVGAIAADNETNKTTYKKTISLGTGKNKGKTVYTETDSLKTSETWSADGGVTLIDSKVGNIAGYKNVEVVTEDGTVQVGRISRTTVTALPVGDLSLDKTTNDHSTKVVTEDSVSTFKVTTTWQDKTTDTATASGKVELTGKRAGEDLVFDTSVVYKTAAEAKDAADAAIEAHKDKQFADVVIGGGTAVIKYDFTDGSSYYLTAAEYTDFGAIVVAAHGAMTLATPGFYRDADAVTALDYETEAVAPAIFGVIGYQDVAVKNATITVPGVQFNGGKYTNTAAQNHTEVDITDNNNDNVSVTNKINDTTNSSYTATGTLTMTNVNYADPNGYVGGSAMIDYTGYTTVNEYVFNGVTYALTVAEQAALLKYADKKEKTAFVYYDNVRRKDDTITTPAVELTGTLQDVVNVQGVDGDTYTQNKVYYAAKAKDGTGAVVDLYVRATKVNELLAGDVVDPANAPKKYTEATVDTSKVYYGAHANDTYLKAAFDTAENLAANVKKYVVTIDNKATTCYLTEAEADVMKTLGGMDVVADSDTAAYTRMTTVGDAVAVNDGAGQIDTATAGTGYEVYEYRGVKKNTGASVLFYLTEAEATACLGSNPDFVTFGKTGTTKFIRNVASVTPGDFEANATAASLRVAVKEYADGVGPNVFLTDDEFLKIKTIDPDYANYAKVDDDPFIRAAKSAFVMPTANDLNTKFTSVNESEEVFEVTNNLTAETLGYLTRAEILALKTTDFDDNYTVNYGTMYLRAAADTTDIIKINAFKEGDGYVLAPGEDLSDNLYNAVANQVVPAKATSKGFQNVMLTNADMGNLEGGNHTEKTSDKLAAKKNSTIATYTTTRDVSDIATGSLIATDSAIGNASWYDKVSLTAAEMDKDNNKAGDLQGGKHVRNVKSVYTSKLYFVEGDYSTPANVVEYTQTTKDTLTANGSAELKNVVAGDISGYKDVTVAFDKAIDTADKTKNEVGNITGGNTVTNETLTYANVNAGSYSETVTKETFTAVGTVDLTNVYAKNGLVAANVSGFATANVTDSEITGDLAGGTIASTRTVVDVNGVTGSTVEEKVVTAAGKAVVDASKVGGDIAQFKDVELTGGVEVGGNIIVGGDDVDAVTRGATENTACYAVFYNDGARKVVYLTSAEYKVFATQEPTAMIDTTVAVYRVQPALTDDELKDVPTAMAAMVAFTAYTDDAITDGGAGQEGRNTTTWVVKTAGNSLKIDESGATVDGKVSGYATVVVSGNSSFAGGYFGTAKNDKLIVDASLATFTPVPPVGQNPVGFDFGDGKDELVLNGTIGVQAAFKYDEATGTNAWNVETISGDGTIVCREEDVKDVKAAFDNIKVYGTKNYDAETALEYQTFDEAKNVGLGQTADINEWMGFCDSADFFQNNVGGDRTLTFTGDSVKSGDVIAQMTVDGGATYTTLKNGDTVKGGAVVRISFSSGSRNTVSSDYTIAFK